MNTDLLLFLLAALSALVIFLLGVTWVFHSRLSSIEKDRISNIKDINELHQRISKLESGADLNQVASKLRKAQKEDYHCLRSYLIDNDALTSEQLSLESWRDYYKELDDYLANPKGLLYKVPVFKTIEKAPLTTATKPTDAGEKVSLKKETIYDLEKVRDSLGNIIETIIGCSR